MKRDLDGLARRKYDLAVVGGGITGAAIARDAALRGLSVALLEARDFSHATSAATSKLVHGGLRYLKTLDLGLVRESLAERRIWLRIAPHMVYPLPFVLPIHGGLAAALAFHAGLTLYDLFAVDWESFGDGGEPIPAHRWLGRKEAVARAPILSGSGLRRAMLYFDCQMFAPERLALECLADAEAHGAQLANYAEVVQVHLASGTSAVESITAEDRMSGRRHDCACRDCRQRHRAVGRHRAHQVECGCKRREASSLQGRAHHHARADDGPRAHAADRERVISSSYRGADARSSARRMRPSKARRTACIPPRAELEGLLATLNRALPGAHLALADIRHAFAGVRPLVAPVSAVSTYKASRRAEIIDHAARRRSGPLDLGDRRQVDDGAPSRRTDGRSCLPDAGTPASFGAHGGAALAGRPYRPFPVLCHPLGERASELSPASVLFLARSYGSMAEDVLDLCREDAALLEPLAPEQPQIGAQVAYAVDHEMALTLEDVVFRRTGLGTLGFPGEAALARATALMAARLGWDERECVRQRESVRARLAAMSQANAAFSA